jgi:hypothetical protein
MSRKDYIKSALIKLGFAEELIANIEGIHVIEDHAEFVKVLTEVYAQKDYSKAEAEALINLLREKESIIEKIFDSPFLPKRKSHAFGKDIYLLGRDDEGTLYWLEAPRWDCNWYWGFGYIEAYENNENPECSKDIISHEHADKFMSEWFIEWNGSKPRLAVRAFTDKEGWELSELFAQFYFLKEAAAMFGRGKAHVSNSTVPLWKDEAKVKEINESLIPIVTARIIEILTPTK